MATRKKRLPPLTVTDKIDFSSSSSTPVLSPSSVESTGSIDAAAEEIVKMKMIADDKYLSSFPPGFRFNPRDDELIEHYLMKKLANVKLPINKIRDVDISKYNPQDLAEMYKSYGPDGERENEWYFFTPRDRKYPNGNRPNRAAGNGYWKATGADKVIKNRSLEIGCRKALVFYEGKAPNGNKTGWIMHEFRIDGESRRARGGVGDMRLDDWVLCRIYEKIDQPKKKKGTNSGSSSECEDLTNSTDEDSIAVRMICDSITNDIQNDRFLLEPSSNEGSSNEGSPFYFSPTETNYTSMHTDVSHLHLPSIRNSPTETNYTSMPTMHPDVLHLHLPAIGNSKVEEYGDGYLAMRNSTVQDYRNYYPSSYQSTSHLYLPSMRNTKVETISHLHSHLYLPAMRTTSIYENTYYDATEFVSLDESLLPPHQLNM